MFGFFKRWRLVGQGRDCGKRRRTIEESEFVEDQFGLIKKVKKLPNYSTKVQAQNVRMYGTKFFRDEVCLTSDIDMFLFNKAYLDSKLLKLDEDSLVILGADAYDSNRPECTGVYSGPDRYPICYVAGKGKTFDDVLKTNVSFEEYMHTVESIGITGDNDELYLGQCVKLNRTNVMHKIHRGYCSNFYAPGRIEKNSFDLTKSQSFALDVSGTIDLSNFIDCHCRSPYQENERLINKIKFDILSQFC